MEPVQEGSGYALVLPTDRENMPSRTAPSSLPVCEHLFSYYSNFERQVDFSQLKASCDRKLGLLFKKAFKMHNDFSAQLNDAE